MPQWARTIRLSVRIAFLTLWRQLFDRVLPGRIGSSVALIQANILSHVSLEALVQGFIFWCNYN
jgi:hypothetical protein